MKYRTYVISTVCYGIMAVLGVLFAVYSLWIQNLILFVVCLLIVYVAIDNFFCGTRLNKAGM